MAGGVVLAAGMMTASVGVAAAAPDEGCLTAGTSGFTAKVVAAAGETISRQNIDATGCDVGIYVADGAVDVTIDRVTVTGANGAGILAENTSHLTVQRSTVHDNGMHTQMPASHDSYELGDLPQAFGISLFGVSDAVVTRNTVYHNGRGGIGIMDTGPFDPGHVVGQGIPLNGPVAVSNVEVSRNTLWANFNGCAIVVSAFNTDNRVSDVSITRNTITGTQFNLGGADVGGIVAQSNGVGSTVADITISRNTVTDSLEAGVIVHAAAPDSHTENVMVTRNTVSGNNLGYAQPGSEVDNTVGVVVSSWLAHADLGQSTLHTVVSRNTITGQFYGIWTQGPDAPTVDRNTIAVTDGGSAYVQAPTG